MADLFQGMEWGVVIIDMYIIIMYINILLIHILILLLLVQQRGLDYPAAPLQGVVGS